MGIMSQVFCWEGWNLSEIVASELYAGVGLVSQNRIMLDAFGKKKNWRVWGGGGVLRFCQRCCWILSRYVALRFVFPGLACRNI